MEESAKMMLMKLVNEAFKEGSGKELFKNGKIDYSVLGDFGNKILGEKNIKMKLKKSQELKDDEITIKIENDELVIEQAIEKHFEFVVKCVSNEFEILNSAINVIYEGQHNDRVAKVISAKRKYLEACETYDRKMKKETLFGAEALLMDGIAEIEKEIKSGVSRINNIPKTFVEKIFGAKISVDDLDSKMEILRESIYFYQEAIALSNILNSELEEMGRVNITIKESRDFLENTFNEDVCIRLDDFEKSDDDFWKAKIAELRNYLIRLETIVDKECVLYLVNLEE